MSQPKRSSSTIVKAERRMASLRSIDPDLDLGNGLTLQTYINSIETARQKLAAYNTTLSNLTQLANDLQAAEQTVADLTTRMLAGVVMKYGRNSTEYEMAGGKRRKAKSTPKSSEASPTPLPTPEPELIVTPQNGKVSSNGAASGTRT